MTTPATPPPQQGEDDAPQGGDDRPTLEELWQRSAVLSEQIAQHLGRGPK